jgi:hypothetical protein
MGAYVSDLTAFHAEGGPDGGMFSTLVMRHDRPPPTSEFGAKFLSVLLQWLKRERDLPADQKSLCLICDILGSHRPSSNLKAPETRDRSARLPSATRSQHSKCCSSTRICPSWSQSMAWSENSRGRHRRLRLD